jgi:hypothetical protein
MNVNSRRDFEHDSTCTALERGGMAIVCKFLPRLGSVKHLCLLDSVSEIDLGAFFTSRLILDVNNKRAYF